VAKGVTIHGVCVLDCEGSGTDAGVLAGMDWVTAEHRANPGQRSVANISLGGAFSQPLNDAVTKVVEAGVTIVVAAGNDFRDACYDSPASAEDALTVGATTIDDECTWFSNKGTCLDIFAPVSAKT